MKRITHRRDFEKHPYYDLVQQGMFDAIREISKTEYKAYFYSNQKLLPKKLRMVIEFNEEEKNKDKIKYYLVTLNFSPEVNIYELIPKFNDYKDLKFVEILRYEWEFTHKDGTYSHPHIHAIVTKLTNRQNFIKRTYNTFKKYLGNRASIDVKSVPIRDFNNILNYVTKSRVADVEYRKKYEL